MKIACSHWEILSDFFQPIVSKGCFPDSMTPYHHKTSIAETKETTATLFKNGKPQIEIVQKRVKVVVATVTICVLYVFVLSPVLYPPGNDHISHIGKFGKSSTQKWLPWVGYVSSQEGITFLLVARLLLGHVLLDLLSFRKAEVPMRLLDWLIQLKGEVTSVEGKYYLTASVCTLKGLSLIGKELLQLAPLKKIGSFKRWMVRNFSHPLIKER